MKGGKTMKSLNIKIPLEVAQLMDNNEQLNPVYITQFIVENYNKAINLNQPIGGMCYSYTLKIDDDWHKAIRLQSFELGLPMNEMVGRLFAKYYCEV